MPLNPTIAAIIAAMPPMPDLRTVDLAAYRAGLNQLTAATPRYDVPLTGVDDRVIAADGVDLAVRVYTPQGKGPLPLLVYYHGGGFVIGDLNIADPICRAIASGAGVIVLSVDYRLAPEYPFPVPNDDCWAALRWAADHAAEIGADASRIAVGGDSAGANLAASMALRARGAGLPLAAQLLLYPGTDYAGTAPSYREHADGPMLTMADIHFFWDHYLPNHADRINPDAAPLHAVSHADLPPAFVATAEFDPSRDAGEAYADALVRAGVEVVARRYAGMPHGFLAWVAHVPEVAAAMDEMCGWLAARVAAVPAPIDERV